MTLALSGVRVLELARYQAGPRGGMILSDLGAEVIKIERLGGEETREKNPPVVRGQASTSPSTTAAKRASASTCALREGKQIFTDLVKKSNVPCLENFRPGTMAAMGFTSPIESHQPRHHPHLGFQASAYRPSRIDPPSIRSARPCPALCPSPANRSAVPCRASRHPWSIATPRCHATIGTWRLRHRDRTGEGQMIDVCLLNSALTMVEIPASYYLQTGEEGGEGGRPYQTKDGHVVISATSRDMTTRLMTLVTGAATDTSPIPIPRPPATAASNWSNGAPAERPTRSLLPCSIWAFPSPVKTIPQMVQDRTCGNARCWLRWPIPWRAGSAPGVTIKLSATPGRVGPAPTPGQHTDEVLRDVLGYDKVALDTLRTAGAIA